MDVTSESLDVDSDPVRHQLPLSREVASEFPPQCWYDTRKLKVLGMGTALPGPPVTTDQLLKLIEDRFGVAVSRRGAALAGRLKIATRHLCRDFETRREAPRPGNSNPDLAAIALRMALEEARLDVHELAYLIGLVRPASSRRTSPSSPTASALPDLTWNCVKHAPVSRTRSSSRKDSS